jgi:purine-nucleoside phosphorylase
MKENYSLQEINLAADVIRSRTQHRPRIGLILGSGLADLADAVEQADRIPYQDIAGWPQSTVEGHKNSLVVGLLEGKPVMVLQGRVHFYEGFSMAQVTFPVRVMQRLGIEILIVTNAAGGINPEYKPGDVMLITDHLSLVTMGGANPLNGANLDEFGPRFPDMSQAYDRELIALARQQAAAAKVELREGVYAGLAGPSFETPADLRFLRVVGADAVGMSTVPEVIVARHGNTRVLGFSGISNKANLDGSTITTHQEVLEAGRVIVPKLKSILLQVLQNL